MLRLQLPSRHAQHLELQRGDRQKSTRNQRPSCYLLRVNIQDHEVGNDALSFAGTMGYEGIGWSTLEVVHTTLDVIGVGANAFGPIGMGVAILADLTNAGILHLGGQIP